MTGDPHLPQMARRQAVTCRRCSRRAAAMIVCGEPVGVDLRDVQIAARHADPRTTMRYGMARKSLDRHPNYILAAYMACGTRPERSGLGDTRHCRIAGIGHSDTYAAFGILIRGSVRVAAPWRAPPYRCRAPQRGRIAESERMGRRPVSCGVNGQIRRLWAAQSARFGHTLTMAWVVAVCRAWPAADRCSPTLAATQANRRGTFANAAYVLLAGKGLPPRMTRSEPGNRWRPALCDRY